MRRFETAIDAPLSQNVAGRVLLLAAIVVMALALCSCTSTGVSSDSTGSASDDVSGSVSTSASGTRSDDEMIEAVSDAAMTPEEEEALYNETHKGHPRTNPLIAQCKGIDLRSPIDPADLTGVLFHQASYKYGLVMTTEMPEADLDEIESKGFSRVNNEQVEGDWLDAEAMHLWRMTDSTDMDTSIDVGAKAGTVVKSPIDGTVVLVKDYMLYGEVPDIEIHIQPDGRPDLDVVLIHTQDPLVKAGDKVQAGVTEISHVRDIAKDLDDVQLAFYTAGDDPGNHTHVQVNDADYEGYRKDKLAGAIKVGESKESAKSDSSKSS